MIPDDLVEYIGWKLPATHRVVSNLMSHIGQEYKDKEGVIRVLSVTTIEGQHSEMLYKFFGKRKN